MARVDERDIGSLVDFDFLHRVALASGNPIYSMFVKSFEPAAKNLATRSSWKLASSAA